MEKHPPAAVSKSRLQAKPRFCAAGPYWRILTLQGERVNAGAVNEKALKVRPKSRARAFSKQHGVLFSPCEMSERILHARAVTENGVLLAPFETKTSRRIRKARAAVFSLKSRQRFLPLQKDLRELKIYCCKQNHAFAQQASICTYMCLLFLE